MKKDSLVGIVLVKAEPEQDTAVYNTLRAEKSVAWIHPICGEYDLIVKIDGAKVDDNIPSHVKNSINSMPGVHYTILYMGAKIE